MSDRIITAVALLILSWVATMAAEYSDNLKPRWLTSSLPQPESPGYIFISAQGTGTTLEEARQRALVNLTAKLEHERGLDISSKITVSERSTRAQGSRSSAVTQTFDLECTEGGKHITLVTRVIDEYWKLYDGIYTVDQLYTVNDHNAPAGSGSYADRISLTTRYGAAPVLMSLIPGAGQIYKGSNVKGGLIMGGAVVCIAGIVTGQVMHNSYINKRIEYPKHFDFYNRKATDWGNVRNVFIGVGAALYVYNLIDAAIAPGRRRVVVERNRSVSLSLSPILIDDHYGNPGAGLALNISF